jgi:teichuronic acid biosynthesis glycosyltransferase TuaG
MFKVSIITPTFNSEKYIKKTIQSVINQTYKNWELIIVDDCSSDSTSDIIIEYTKIDSRIKLLVNNVNCGAAISRNRAITQSTGRFLSFLDADDIWFYNKLELQTNFMLINNYPISFTSYCLINDDGENLNQVVNAVKEIGYNGYLKNTIIGMSTSMIDLWQTGVVEFINIRTRQDTYLWISLLKKGFKAYGIDSILVNYRLSKNSISKNKFKAAKNVWILYYKYENFGILKSFYYFSYYLLNAIKKRI